MRKGYRRPKNENDFEELCLKLLQAHWKCPELGLYAVKGQAQHGVDIVDMEGKEPLKAAQCKLHEEGKTTTPKEVKEEVCKAKGFPAPLGRYAILTTGKVGREVHDLIIKINQEHRKKNLFAVQILDWSDIERLLDTYSGVCSWYEGYPDRDKILRGLDSKMDAVQQSNKINSMDLEIYRDDQIHTEIDEARDHLIKGDSQVAKILFLQLKRKKWERLRPEHKFRILSGLANVELLDSNPERAADLLLEAKNHHPNDELAQTNEARAYFLLGERARAYERAIELRKQYPDSALIVSICVLSAPDQESVESVEREIPQELLENEEVIAGMSERAWADGDFEKAEKLARTGIDSGSQEPGLFLLLGKIILQSEMSRSQGLREEMSPYRPERISEAEDALGTAIDLSKKIKNARNISLTLEALIDRISARLILNKEELAKKDVEEALEISPKYPQALVAQAEFLRFENRAVEAIDTLRHIAPQELSPQGHILLAALLLERGDAGDLSNASSLASKMATSNDKIPQGLREDCIEIALQALAKNDNLEACREVLSQVPQNSISQVGRLVLTGKLSLLEERQEEASMCADDALALVDEKTNAFDLQRLAKFLSELSRYADALPLWQRIALPNYLGPDTKRLLECASHLHRHEIMLETFRNLRNAGQIDRETLDHELSLLEMYDTDKTIQILNEEIAKRPQDKELKLRRSWLGLSLNRDDLIDKNPENVPGPSETEPLKALQAVHVLRAIGKKDRAVLYAYEFIRHNYREPDAHRAIMVALGPFGPKVEIETPTVVGVDTAVCYQETGNDNLQWIIVEKNPDPNSQLPERELEIDHEICKEMMGKKAGNDFILARGGLQDRTGKIKAIQNKYVYRLQQAMGQWQVNFPALQEMQVINLQKQGEKSPDSDLDFSVVIKSVHQQHEDVKKILQVYQEGKVPLHVLGERFGKTAFEAILSLAQELDVEIRCCVGSAVAREQGKELFRSCNTLVLDMSAIGTLFLLDIVSCLDKFQVDIIVSQGTINSLRLMVANEDLIQGHAGFLVKSGQGIALQEASPEQTKIYMDKLRDLISALERHCKIESCEKLAEIEPSKRGSLVEFFGQYGAEAMVLADLPERVLWSDDLAQAVIANSELGVSRVWTQLFLEFAAESGEIDNEELLVASAKLTGFGYSFTSQWPETILQAGKLAEWKIEREPLSRALKTFSDDSIDLMQIIRLVVGFLKLIYLEPIILITRENVTIAVLEEISKKENGIQGIRVLHKYLPDIFGLNVVGLDQASQTIESWLRRKII